MAAAASTAAVKKAAVPTEVAASAVATSGATIAAAKETALGTEEKVAPRHELAADGQD